MPHDRTRWRFRGRLSRYRRPASRTCRRASARRRHDPHGKALAALLLPGCPVHEGLGPCTTDRPQSWVCPKIVVAAGGASLSVEAIVSRRILKLCLSTAGATVISTSAMEILWPFGAAAALRTISHLLLGSGRAPAPGRLHSACIVAVVKSNATLRRDFPPAFQIIFAGSRGVEHYMQHLRCRRDERTKCRGSTISDRVGRHASRSVEIWCSDRNRRRHSRRKTIYRLAVVTTGTNRKSPDSWPANLSGAYSGR